MIHHPNKRELKRHGLHRELAVVSERRNTAATDEEFEQYIREEVRIQREIRAVEAEPEVFDCPGCDKEEAWGNHILVPARAILLPPSDDPRIAAVRSTPSDQYEALELSTPIQLALCIDCAEAVGLLKILAALKAKLVHNATESVPPTLPDRPPPGVEVTDGKL